MSINGSLHCSTMEVYTPQEITQLLDDRYVKSNTVKSIENFSKTFEKQFSNIQFIHDVKTNSNNLSESITDYGTRVFFYAADLIDNQDNIMKIIVLNNTNINSLEQECLERRYLLDEEKSKLEEISRHTPIEPNKQIYDIKSRMAIVQYKKQLEEDFRVLNNQSADPLPPEDYVIQCEYYVESRITKFSSDTIDKFDFQFAVDYDEYTTNLKLKNNSNHQLKLIQHKHDREVILEIVLQTYNRTIKTILQLIKNVVKSNEHLTQLLKGITIISTTKEEIFDPYTNHSLSGIYQILNDKYKKKSFVVLCNHLLTLLSWQQADEDIDNPEKALIKMNTVLSNWTKQDLYSLMTKDIFFSACLIKGLSPKCSLKSTLIIEVIKHINKIESSNEDFQLYSSNNSNMPIYSFVSNLIQVDAESKKLLSHTSLKRQGDPPKPPVSPPFSPNRYNNNGNNRTSNYKVEQASATEVSEQIYDTFSHKPFEKEITKSNNIHIKFNNSAKELIKKPYLALKTLQLICLKCYPEDKSSTFTPCKPKCFGALCERCYLFGHATKLCLQAKDKDGNPIQKTIK